MIDSLIAFEKKNNKNRNKKNMSKKNAKKKNTKNNNKNKLTRTKKPTLFLKHRKNKI